MRLRIVPVFVALLAGCNGVFGDPKADEHLVTVHVLSPVGGTFTVTSCNANGACAFPSNGNGSPSTFPGTGSFQEVMRSGSFGSLDTTLQQIRGSYTGPSLVVGFGTRFYSKGGSSDGLGAKSGSLQSLSGPDPLASPCQLKYGASEPGGSTYRVQYRLTDVITSVCRQP